MACSGPAKVCKPCSLAQSPLSCLHAAGGSMPSTHIHGSMHGSTAAARPRLQPAVVVMRNMHAPSVQAIAACTHATLRVIHPHMAVDLHTRACVCACACARRNVGVNTEHACRGAPCCNNAAAHMLRANLITCSERVACVPAAGIVGAGFGSHTCSLACLLHHSSGQRVCFEQQTACASACLLAGRAVRLRNVPSHKLVDEHHAHTRHGCAFLFTATKQPCAASPNT
jgi:hypothetical protein